jgi:hypothetical protein
MRRWWVEMRLEAEVVDGFDPLERVAAVTPPDFILTGGVH